MANSMGRQIFKGILEYVNEHPECRNWRFHPPLNQLSIDQLTLQQFSPVGVISQVPNRSFLQGLDDERIARVNVSSWIKDEFGPTITADNITTGKLAADHFLSRKFQHFAYVGVQGALYSEKRFSGFYEVLDKMGLSKKLYATEIVANTVYLDGAITKELEHWLGSLPMPVAVFAATDGLARRILEFCERTGIRCPDQIAVLGVDNDEFDCAISPVSLSSVALPFQAIGKMAAEKLHSQLELGINEQTREGSVLPPLGIVTRRSTELLAVQDPILSRALECIRVSASRHLTIDSLAQTCGVSRRLLERRFRSVLGCSPNEEILRFKIQKVQFMLAETNLSVTEIAQRLGYQEPKYLHRIFRKFCGSTPLEYRNTFQR
ncbi:MAG: substrate-binding domain-containing protein [Verrucomicrobia bacterium]|nr:substrate-binding domain-containing protein [Verrucomicrobiota bacterium]